MARPLTDLLKTRPACFGMFIEILYHVTQESIYKTLSCSSSVPGQPKHDWALRSVYGIEIREYPLSIYSGIPLVRPLSGRGNVVVITG